MNFSMLVPDAKCRKAIELAIAQQFIALLATAFLLDGGRLLNLSLSAVVAHWVVILVILVRRRSSPTKLDLGLIGFGLIPAGVLAIAVAGLLGRSVTGL